MIELGIEDQFRIGGTVKPAICLDFVFQLTWCPACVTERKYVQAKAEYQHVLSRDPANVQTHMNLGLLLDVYLSDPHAAFVHYRKYVALGGDDARIRRRIRDLRKEAQAKKRPRVPPTEPIKEIPKTPHPEEGQDWLRGLLRWRDVVVGILARYRIPLRVLLYVPY